MRTDFGDLVIEQAIVHLVPRRRKTDPVESKIQLSETVCTLTHAVRTELQGKLRDVLASLGREVVEDPELKSELPDHVRDFLEERHDLVEVSQDLARLLQTSQSGVSPAGLLLVASATLEGQKAMLMVKLEQETGMQANQIVTENGLRTFDVQYFANLLFTETSRVYKVALFATSGASDEGLEGWAADKQMSGKTLAKFFQEKFLGCRLKDEPRQVTLHFHDAAVNWINTRFSDAETRIAYLMAVLVELQSPAATLDPVAFIKSRLQPQHRDDFADFLRESDVPDRTFDKDTELVDSKLKKLRVEFDNGAFLVAPLEALEGGSTITFEDLNDGRTTLTVTGTMTSSRSYATSGGRPRSTKQPNNSANPQARAQLQAHDDATDHQ
ncbi:nucleoid-associated protein [Streptomyces sp. ID38640]|uniref:nucleoid-associated protein n=1 Tax=Streptomyces sp. ID38640 TaxID=1265399 RepID=UPI00140EF536|nr:nucleoid-associated protein [Streptomyces sp. ID38640]QIK04711.1 nucleoid-associated protein [Streptomyces sp. ID38640]QIK10876.1 nucleoid-associated protein [Streptomyces sp. ID38640]QIK10935.1 nucleoid-associated protein [Streptomyces sp. ID38640]